jgi:hypothetical protein
LWRRFVRRYVIAEEPPTLYLPSRLDVADGRAPCDAG